MTAAAWLLAGASAAAQNAADALTRVLASHTESRAVQQRIEGLLGDRNNGAAALADRQLDSALANAERQLGRQQLEFERVGAAIVDHKEAEAGLLPLLETMLDVLAASIDLSLPVGVERRRSAIADARRKLTRHDLTLADRYAAVLDVYHREIQFSYGSDIVSEQIDVAGESRLVRLLRIGRVALYFVTPDAGACGVWRPASRDYARLAPRDCVVLADQDDASELATLLLKLPLAGDAP